MRKQLNGQAALVTGGSRGIGFGIAQALLKHGMHVAITGRNESSLAEAKRRLDQGGKGRIETHTVDVRDHAATTRAVNATAAAFGGLDVVVNNAGIGTFANIADMTPAQWSEVIDTNVTGVFNVCHAALPLLRQRGGGYIFNISSLAGTNVVPQGAAYCASKAGLNAFSEVLNQEVRHDNIRVSYIMPGSVATGFAGNDAAKGADWKIGGDDLAEAVLDLLRLDSRTLISRIEVRPARPPRK